MREAEETARRGVQWLIGSYAGPQHQPNTSIIGFGVAADAAGRPIDPVERYLQGVVIWGTPESVTDEILRLREEMFLDYLLCAPLSHETFTLFTDRVLPRIGA